MSDLGRTFFALQCLTSTKRLPTVGDCLNAGIRIAMDRQEFEVAAALRDLREQIVDRALRPDDRVEASAGNGIER